MASGNMTHLEWNGRKLRVRVSVSAKARALLGKQCLKVPLGHGDIRRAQVEKHAIIGRLKTQIAAAEREADKRAKMDPLDREALALQEAFATVAEAPDPAREQECFGDHLENRANAIEARQGYARADEFIAIATGRATPLDAHLDAFLDAMLYDPKRKGLQRRAIKRLQRWCAKAKVPQTVQAITPAIASRFEDQEFPAASTPAQTFASYKTAFRAYWKWLIARDLAPAPNPWDGRRRQAAKAHRSEEDTAKRPFTNAEVQTLLNGPTSPRLQAVMLIAALSGMRLGEIARLRVRHVQGDVFNIRVAKTAAGRRMVPIHSQLAETIASLAEGKSLDAFLIGGLADPPDGSERTRFGPITKEFNRYRKRMGVDDKATGQRQSNCDFHSFRRWFIHERTRPERLALRTYTETTLFDVVGHDRKVLGMTLGVYTGTASEAEKRACVEASGLP